MRGLVGIVAVVVAIGLAPDADACTCGEVSVAAAKQNADVVFAGTVASVDVVDTKDDWEPRIVVRFKVARVWKGGVGAEFSMHTNFEASSCGGFFREMLEESGPLLVYAYGRPASAWKQRNEGGAVGAGSFTKRGPATDPANPEFLDLIADDAIAYTTDICTRTKPVRFAVDDFDQLGAARELAPLSLMPDRALVESMRPKFNAVPRNCSELTDARVWRVLTEPPANAPELMAVLSAKWKQELPKDPALDYGEFWFAAEDGRVGFCRAPKDETKVCGRANVQFVPDPAKSGEWKVGDSAANAYCPGIAK